MNINLNTIAVVLLNLSIQFECIDNMAIKQYNSSKSLTSNSTVMNQSNEYAIYQVKPKRTQLEEMMKKLSDKKRVLTTAKNMESELFGLCKLGSIEMSLNLPNCGRILFNTTMCSGFCKSSETIIPYTKTKKTVCSGCKATSYNNVKYTVKCIDNSLTTFQIKAVSKCSCFKQTDRLDRVDESKIFEDRLDELVFGA